MGIPLPAAGRRLLDVAEFVGGLLLLMSGCSPTSPGLMRHRHARRDHLRARQERVRGKQGGVEWPLALLAMALAFALVGTGEVRSQGDACRRDRLISVRASGRCPASSPWLGQLLAFPRSRAIPRHDPARKEPGLTPESTRTRSSRSDGGLSLRDSDTADPELAWRSINAIRALAMDAVEAAQSGHPGHADGARPRRLRPVDAASSGTIPPIPTGPTATASSSPAATPRCCSTRCST